MSNDERRTAASPRVPVGTLVEICGNEPGIPAFEAESVDVSARGMHVRTAYLPELGAPLVCRFEDRGREIVVEGSVAWRKEGAKGGEFGMQFTALDSGSVDALRELCGVPDSSPPPDAQPEEPGGASSRNAPGSRVRLHIDGLGSPMKARVRGASERSVQVGSNLEFLKVGRRLEVEDLEAGSKRGANIDSVSVAIDPSTQIPQLVVVLRYDDGSETTPEPSVIDSEVGATHRSPIEAAHLPSSEREASASADSDDALDDEEAAAAELAEEDEVAEEANALRGRLAVAATNAGAAVQKTGAMLGRFGVSAAAGVGKLFKGASERVLEYRRQHDGKTEPRRTAPPPSGVLSVEGRRLRPQSSRAGGAVEDEQTPAPKSKRVKRAAIGAAIAVLLVTVSVIAMRKPSPPPGAEASAAPAVAVASAENVTQVDEQGNPVDPSKPPAAASLKTELGAEQGGGVSADVPLFGPTPMATMEPAPLGPAPEPGAAPEGGEEAAEKAAASAAQDESWQEPGDQPSAPKARPEDVEPWGRGKVHTPTIHRMRLDGPGTSIQGAINPTGFTVVIPGRKVMESGGVIEKRDKRIARVRTKNGGSGAQIAFQFRDGVPAYRVRLRKDYVEILISAPPVKPTPAVQHAKSSMQPAKRTPNALQKKPMAKPVAKKPLAKIAKPKKG